MSEKYIAVFMAPGCEEIEALTVVDILFRAGIPHKMVSITDAPRRTRSPSRAPAPWPTSTSTTSR